MTRINKNSGPGGPDKARGPQDSSGPQGPSGVGKSNFIDSVKKTEGVGGVTSPEQALANRMHGLIRDGVSRQLPREEVLRSVVDSELERAFGKHASPSMKESVTAAFEDEPNLRALFNDLYDRATRGT